MSAVAKVIVTVIISVLAFFIIGAIGIVQEGKNGPFSLIAFILLAGAIVGVRAVWKKPKKEDNSEGDFKLNKRE